MKFDPNLQKLVLVIHIIVKFLVIYIKNNLAYRLLRDHTHTHISKVGDRSRRHPESSLFNSYYTEV